MLFAPIFTDIHCLFKIHFRGHRKQLNKSNIKNITYATYLKIGFVFGPDNIEAKLQQIISLYDIICMLLIAVSGSCRVMLFVLEVDFYNTSMANFDKHMKCVTISLSIVFLEIK